MNDLITNHFQIKVKVFLNLIETCVVVLHSKWLYKQCWLGSVADGTKVCTYGQTFFSGQDHPGLKLFFFFQKRGLLVSLYWNIKQLFYNNDLQCTATSTSTTHYFWTITIQPILKSTFMVMTFFIDWNGELLCSKLR